jgi:tryptophanyl-tRNA synthetase
VTDATPVEDPKDPEQCTVFRIFRVVAGADDERTRTLADRYRAGGLGYGEAKQQLFELLMDHFGPARQRREQLMNDPAYIDEVLTRGAQAARQKITEVTRRAREACGLGAAMH